MDINNNIIVIKIGSMAMVNDEKNDVNYNIIAKLSRQLKPNMILVSSGATEIGRLDYIKRTGQELSGNIDDIKADYASQGQAVLMGLYRSFIDSRLSVRQILVEHQHFNDEKKKQHLKSLLYRCASQNAIPIINYNDSISSEENRKMEIQALKSKNSKTVECIDNDETATQIAICVNAKYLILFTSVDGIYSDINNPLSLIKQISGTKEQVLHKLDELKSHCNGASRKGSNGALAKLEYIKSAIENNIHVIIASPKFTIQSIIDDKVPCTQIFCNIELD